MLPKLDYTLAESSMRSLALLLYLTSSIIGMLANDPVLRASFKYQRTGNWMVLLLGPEGEIEFATLFNHSEIKGLWCVFLLLLVGAVNMHPYYRAPCCLVTFCYKSGYFCQTPT